MARPCPCLPELGERAVRMVAETRPNCPTEWAAMKVFAAKLGIGPAETVHTRVGKAEVDADQRPGTLQDVLLIAPPHAVIADLSQVGS